ncbi:MAG: PTS system mannose/fructose/N-acetylgalactosamine-transporter subunit IIB [Eubacteriales bacterium]
MGELSLVRIDDRLIHGQVMTAWLNFTSANRIVIVDNETAKDPFMRSILEMVIPSGIKLDICDISKGAEILLNLKLKDKVIVLMKNPIVAVGLVKQGVAIQKLNVGGMGAKPGRQKLYKNITISEEEKEIFKNLMEQNIIISVQIIPDEKEIFVNKLIK